MLITSAHKEYRNSIRAVVADSAFSSIESSMYAWCKDKLPWLPQFFVDYLFFWFGLFLPCPIDDLKISDRMGKITAPVMIVHGTTDGLVPYTNAEELTTAHRLFNNSVLHTFTHTHGHVAPWREESYFGIMVDFFELYV